MGGGSSQLVRISDVTTKDELNYIVLTALASQVHSVDALCYVLIKLFTADGVFFKDVEDDIIKILKRLEKKKCIIWRKRKGRLHSTDSVKHSQGKGDYSEPDAFITEDGHTLRRKHIDEHTQMNENIVYLCQSVYYRERI